MYNCIRVDADVSAGIAPDESITYVNVTRADNLYHLSATMDPVPDAPEAIGFAPLSSLRVKLPPVSIPKKTRLSVS
jgi:hypothetical protein